MAISKSTPYVRYKKDFTSSLHLGTIHIESEYLDRTQKTTIESIHGMTWHNKVVNENKELNLLSDTQLELTELEKQYWNTGEKRVSVDEIHTLEEVEPNEDGTYTYTVNSMEGEYIEIYDGINNITSTSDGLDGQFEIVYDTTEEDINGNIALDQVAPQYEITDSGVGTITSAKSTGLTLVNHITEPSKEEVVAIEQQEGQHFTINNTVQGNIKSAILKGDTALNRARKYSKEEQEVTYTYNMQNELVVSNNPTPLLQGQKIYMSMEIKISELSNDYPHLAICTMRGTGGFAYIVKSNAELHEMAKNVWIRVSTIRNVVLEQSDNGYSMLVMVNNSSVSNVAFGKIATRKPMWINLSEKFGMGNEPTREQCDEMFEYFEGMQSVKMPVLTVTNGNLLNLSPNTLEMGTIMGTTGELVQGNTRCHTTNIKVSQKDDLFLKRINCNYQVAVRYYYGDTLVNKSLNNNGSFIVDGNLKVNDGEDYDSIKLIFAKSDDSNLTIEEVANQQIMLVPNNNYTTYEPHKSNILTVNEDVELRGIGEVQDELNLLTGELTQCFDEITFDGSDENFIYLSEYSNNDVALFEYQNYFNFNLSTLKRDGNMMSDKFSVNSQYLNPTKEGVYCQFKHLNVMIDKSKLSKLSSSGFHAYLKQNPIKMILPKQKSIKTVDLTVQNQDGNTIPHIQTQPTITHVSTSSDGLIPTVEMSCSYDTIIKPNTTYTIKLDRPIVSDTMYLQVDLGGTMMMLDADVNSFTIKTPSTLSHSQLRLSGTGNTVKEIIVLEGNRVNDKIEYFEGMKNVENPILVVSNCQYVFGKGGRI